MRTLQAFMGHRSISNTVIYTAVADKHVRNIWGQVDSGKAVDSFCGLSAMAVSLSRSAHN
jgi:hypothetical protein